MAMQLGFSLVSSSSYAPGEGLGTRLVVIGNYRQGGFHSSCLTSLYLYRESGVFPPAEDWLSFPAGHGWCRCPTVRPAGLSSGPAEEEGR